YTLPSPDDNYDLVLNGPQGRENIQIVASREQFPIPDWYRNSGQVCDWDSRDDYMDYLNGRYFVRYDGQRFAYDRAVVFVDEWEPNYFRPVYYPYYPSWSVCGNVYIDYPWGSSVYINGYYWGCTPLYIPRILVGWHTITVYDPWGYCWEDDFHVSRYNTVIFNKTIIRTRPSIRSKYKEVREVGYRDPLKAGYPDFYQKVAEKKAVRSSSSGSGKAVVDGSAAKVTRDVLSKKSYESFTSPAKKYVRGESKLVKGDRGYETRGVMLEKSAKSSSARESSRTYNSDKSRGSTTTYGTDDNRTVRRSGRSVTPSGNDQTYRKSQSSRGSTETRNYYKKKSGSTTREGRSSSTVERRSTTKKSTPTYNRPSQPKSSGKSRSSSSPQYKAPKKSSSGGSSSSAKSRPSSSGSSKSSSGKSSSSRSSSSKKRSK
ncbi:MAG: PEGA domain-containing protein, partial [Candidatus Zixiibacteriota bacterium]